MMIRPVAREDWEQWNGLRLTLWPDAESPDDAQDMEDYLAGERMAAFVAVTDDGQIVGFVETNIRYYADGCETRNVGYVEGWYVGAEYRRQGVGAALVRAAEDWARGKGCREMGSDCYEDNEVSLSAHAALGYEEKERLVHFGKRL